MKTIERIQEEVRVLSRLLLEKQEELRKVKIETGEKYFSKKDVITSFEDGYEIVYTVYHNGLEFDFSSPLEEGDERMEYLFDMEEVGECTIL